MYNNAISLDGDTYDAFMKAVEELAKEQGSDEEHVRAIMKKIIYLFVTRI